jgi:DNA-binding beta-propeller fold protein YncE
MNRPDILNFRPRASLFLALLLIGLLTVAFTGSALAQAPPPERKTVFMIDSIDGGILNFPLNVYAVNGTELIKAQQFTARDHDMGPVGLAVDEVQKFLFISYEGGNRVEVFSAEDAHHIDSIRLWGTDDLAGMVVHQTREELYVVDRDEYEVYVFDTNSFALIDQWSTFPGGGAWGIDLMGEVLYVADATQRVWAYDIVTKQLVDYYDLPQNNIAISVTDYPEPMIVTTGGYSHNNFCKYLISSGLSECVSLGTPTKGVSLNPYHGVAYVATGLSNGRMNVVDVETMTALHSYVLSNSGWSPTDVLATYVQFTGVVDKTCTSHPTGELPYGQQAIFEVAIQNRHLQPIHKMPLKDTYDNSQLSFVSANPATDDNIDDGILDWTDLISQFGDDLDTGDTYTVTVTFDVLPDPCVNEEEGVNIAEMIDAEDVDGLVLDEAAGSFEYKILCSCVDDEDCDDGQFCTGDEFCNAQFECESTGNPCPIDDEIWCNGAETAQCDEATDSCGHAGTPCPDDLQFCSGTETCNEAEQSCEASGNPCEDDGEYCNGSESCDENADQCASSGDPCPPNETCEESNDRCVDLDLGDDDDDDDTTEDPDGAGAEDYWPEGDVSGGCCSC